MDTLAVDFDKVNGLVPAIVQDENSKEVLMLGYMNKEALDRSLESGKVTFYSRTKKRLWTKGETSGNFLSICKIELDCDNDTLLIQATPRGRYATRATILALPIKTKVNPILLTSYER